MDGITPDYWIENQEECHELLKENWDKVPLLDLILLHSFKEGQMIRFRGMIQDMLNPLLYFTKIEALNLETKKKEIVYGKYKECAFFENYEELDLENDLMVDQERRPYYCISTPGLNDWALPVSGEPFSMEAQSRKNDEQVEEVEMEEKTNGSPGNQQKRPNEEEGSPGVPELGSKRQRTSASTTEKENEMNLYFPIPSRNNLACVVTLYDTEDGAVRLNEVIEAVGFVWRSGGGEGEDDDEGEGLAPSLPPLVPRLHAVAFKKVSNEDLLPTRPAPPAPPDSGPALSEADSLRADLHLALSQLMLGDSLAADYLICNLISSIYVRQDFLALGKLCVNFSNVPSGEGYTDGFYSVLKSLVAKSHYLPFSLQSMNTLSLLPEKDYEKNRLKSGVLQLSDHTHLVLDETKMQVGRLEEKGVLNVKALNDLITFQRLVYNFRFHTMDFQTDIPVVTLSEGKSMLKFDVEVLLEPTGGCEVGESLEAVRGFLKEPLLPRLRAFLAAAAATQFDVPQDLLNEVIERDYVEMRQDPELKTTVDDLHTLLVLARLVSLSHGKQTMCKETWRKAVSMERERKTRLARRNQPR